MLSSLLHEITKEIMLFDIMILYSVYVFYTVERKKLCYIIFCRSRLLRNEEIFY